MAIVSTTKRIHDRAAELGVTGFVADLTDEAEVGALVDAVTEQLGDVNVLVNNAGLASKASPEVLRPVAQLSFDEWRVEIDRNLTTAFLTSRAVVAGMAERGWGRIVNLSATAGPVNALPTEAAYAAAKAGVLGLTRALAMEVVADGVTVNAVAPGHHPHRQLDSGRAQARPGHPDGSPGHAGRGGRRDRVPLHARPRPTSPGRCWSSTAVTASARCRTASARGAAPVAYVGSLAAARWRAMTTQRSTRAGYRPVSTQPMMMAAFARPVAAPRRSARSAWRAMWPRIAPTGAEIR